MSYPVAVRRPLAAVVSTLLVGMVSVVGFAAPSTAAATPRLFVSQAPREGGAVTVTGFGFDPGNPVGVYVGYGPADSDGFYGGGELDPVWIAPGNVVGGGAGARTAPMAPDGTFSVTVTVPAYAQGIELAIFASKAHGQGVSDHSQDARRPVRYQPTTATFRDVPVGTQFFAEIEWLAAEGISTGYTDETFRPVTPVRRDAMAAFLYRLAGSPAFSAPSSSPFRDISPGVQFYEEMTWLASVEISTGYGDGTFRPLASVNRDAMAAFLYRFAHNVLGEDNGSFTPPSSSPFGDVGPGVQFYREMTWLADQGISTGYQDGTFRPLSPVNRDAMAAFMNRLVHPR